jgi:hypothetical protein
MNRREVLLLLAGTAALPDNCSPSVAPFTNGQ